MQRVFARLLVLGALTLSLVAVSAEPVAASPGFQAVSLTAGPTFGRLAGQNRYQTAVAVSQAAWPDGSSYVVIATGEDFPDSAVAAPLAGACDAPLLLTPSARLPLEVGAEMNRLGATHVVVVGGVSAVSEAVVRQVRSLGITDVTRIGGRDRYATAADVALHVAGTKDTWGIVVATGADFADCVAVSGLASALHTPVLLTRPNALPAETAAAIARIDPRGTLIVGAEAAVSAAVESKLPHVRRVGGVDRYATAVAIAELAEEAGFTSEEPIVASGTAFPDAIVSGPLAASLRAPLVLVKSTSLPDPSRAWLEARCSQMARVRVVGGAVAVSEATVAALREATETRMSPRTRVGDAALASMVTTVAPDGSSITFSGWSEALRALATGDILIFEASENVPDGFLGTVTRVEEQAAGVVVFASDASLADAFEKAGVSYILRSTEDSASAAVAGSVSPAGFFEDVGSWISSAGSALFDAFKDSGESMWDLVYLLATGDYEEGFTADADFNWTSPEMAFTDGGQPVGSVVAQVWSSPTVRFGVLIEDYSLDYAGLYAFDYPIARLAANVVGEGHGSRRVYTRDLGVKNVKVGGIKVPFHNYLHLNAGMDVYETQGVSGLKIGEACAVVELESYVDDDGFHYGTARSGLDYFDIPAAGDAFVDPNARFQGDEDFDVWMGVRLESLAYNAAGPFVDARAILNNSVDSKASSSTGAWRTVTARLRADLGLHLKKIVDYEHTVTGIDLGSKTLHQDKGPFPAHKIALARPAGENSIRVRLDGPGSVDAATVSVSDFFSLPVLTLLSVTPQGGGDFILTCAEDLDRTAAYDVYLKAGSIANTAGVSNTVQSVAGFDCKEAPEAMALWLNHDTIEVGFYSDHPADFSVDPSPAIVLTRDGTPVPVASLSWSAGTLSIRLAEPPETEPVYGEYEVGIPFGCVRAEDDLYYSFSSVAKVVPRYYMLEVESVDAVDYSHVDVAFSNNFYATTDILTVDPSRFAIGGEHAVSVLGAAVLGDGATVRLTTTKMPYTTGTWAVTLASGAVIDATGRSNKLETVQFAPAPRATLVSASAVDATHADLLFEGFAGIASAAAGGIRVDGVVVSEAAVLSADTVRITTPVQHVGKTCQVVVAEGAVMDGGGTENARGVVSFAAFASPEMRSAWATNQTNVRLDFDVAVGESLDPASLTPSAFTLGSEAAVPPSEIVDVAVGLDGLSVSVTTSGTVPFTLYDIGVAAGAVADTAGTSCIAAAAAYEYSPPLISGAEALGPRSVLLQIELAPERPVDPATVQPADFAVVDLATGEESTPTAASVLGDGRAVVLTLAEETSAGAAYVVSSGADAFADTAGTWNHDTQAPFLGYDLSVTARRLPVSPGHDVSHLVAGEGGILWAEHRSGYSPGDTDALAWWRPGSTLPFGMLTGGVGSDPWYAHKMAALDGNRALVPGLGGSDVYVWTDDDAVSDPIHLDMTVSQAPFPFYAGGGTMVYGAMFGGVAIVDTSTWGQTNVAPGLYPEWPTISGDRIALTSRYDGRRDVWVLSPPWDWNAMNVADADLDEPIASVSGTKVAYIYGGDVFVYDFTPGVYQEIRITNTPQLESRAVMSGDRVVFERREEAGAASSVHLIELDSGFETTLSEGLTDARLPWICGDIVGFAATGSTGAEVWRLDVGAP